MSKVYKDLKRVVSNTMAELAGKIIIHTGDIYVIYNQYAVVKRNGGFLVVRRSDDREFNFGSMKYAVAWAILDKYNRLVAADRVYELAQLIDAAKTEKLIHERLKKRGSIDQHVIQHNKLQSAIDKQKRFIAEIDKYIITADSCHQRGIRNELNGTSRK